MVSRKAFDTLATSLPNVTTAPHVDRTAYRSRIIFATIGKDPTVNLKLDAGVQEVYCRKFPRAFVPVAGGWGRQGWTTVHLKEVSEEALTYCVRVAYELATQKVSKKRPPKAKSRAEK